MLLLGWFFFFGGGGFQNMETDLFVPMFNRIFDSRTSLVYVLYKKVEL